MIKSRCGINCDTQKCKEAFGVDCAGCIKIDRPFYGNCSVKTCCESKQHSHCGVCADFPCDMLNKFSYDEQHGDNGARIEQCKEWAKL